MKLQGNWKRGSLHTHTYWSDGRAFPEQMVGTYKGLGYDFVCFSDHNIFPVDKNFWLPVRADESHWPPMIARNRFNDYVKNYPNSVEQRRVSYHTMVRLKTYDEVKPMFEEPGKFLVIGGEEFTGAAELPEGRFDVHFNILNLEKDLPVPPSGTVEEMIDRYIEAYKKAIEGWPHPTLFMLNHPQWRYWDVSPHQVADLPIVRHFEVCNGGMEYDVLDGMPTTDKFWDVVNAYRCAKGMPLMFGTASDDSHFYLTEEAMADYDFSKMIKSDDRATTMELIATLDGYSIGSGMLSAEDAVLSGLVSIKLKEEDPLTIGYIVRKGAVLSKYGKAYVEKLLEFKEI